MSRITRLLPSFGAGRRGYSFFSNKPGGGRYFNSAKTPKSIAPSTPSQSTPSSSSGNGNAASGKSAVDATAATTTEAAEVTEELPSPSVQRTSEFANAGAFPSTTEKPRESIDPPQLHPVLRPHEFKLHHFFALHRPYLLINQPTSSLFESTQSVPSPPTPASFGTIDDPPEATPEADADAARQLSRALVVNRVGGSVDFEDALRRLGLNITKEPLPPLPDGIRLDSTKRKRRKKMKKHKLKKRRRLQRATRRRLGK